ncbi:relaxase/mobilization nuclease domain-containing protein [Flagellimonas algicola]|uniref:Mobilization protein n=1 Tax=Flagellimonas algicola TaxID=2583815 RepID=A0ABY2WJ00_9FLAO|nr:relaxase/mobilization nuclease domain-containing protein [Allomuricauda algicola]TMU54822.1 mobilization protein [Allomuricauda algicola]
MIGKGKSISHTKASISYGWNQEKEAEIIYKKHLMGETPKEIAQEFKIIQDQNCRCKNNTLSFVLSPTIEDGKHLTKEQFNELTQKFLQKMKLENRQAIAFVHRDKQHIHIHLYVNRIGFDGKAYNDSYIGKRSQHTAGQVAKEMGLTTVREVQQEKINELKQIRQQIKNIHQKVLQEHRPQNFDHYIHHMKREGVKVIPSINKQNKLQGFRFEYQGYNLKGSEVHRSMSGGKLALELSKNTTQSLTLKQGKAIVLFGRLIELSTNLALKIAKHAIKKTLKKGMDIGF